jgi:heat shock protein HslJ
MISDLSRPLSTSVTILALAAFQGCAPPEPDSPDVPSDEGQPSAEAGAPLNEASEDSIRLAGLEGSWVLVALGGEPLPELEQPVTLEIRGDGSVGGFSGVNRYNTTLHTSDLAEGHLAFGLVATTMMAGPPEAMEFERVFGERLAAVSTFSVEGERLRLYAGGDEALTFERASSS